MITKVIKNKNIFEQNHGIAFSFNTKFKEGLSSLIIRNRKKFVNETLEDLKKETFLKLQELLIAKFKEWDAYIILTNSGWQEENRIVKYKKLWKTLTNNIFNKGEKSKEEILIKSEYGIRYVSSIKINFSDISDFMLNIKSSYGFLIISKRDLLKRQNLIEMANHIKTKKFIGINALKLLDEICLKKCLKTDDLLVKSFGEFDDIEYEINLMMRKDVLKNI